MNLFPFPRASVAAMLCGAAFTVGGCASAPAYTSRPVAESHSSAGAMGDLRLARGALDSGDTALAASMYERALSAAPDSPEAMLGLAEARYQAGDLEQAAQMYTRAARHPAASAAARLGLARIAVRQRHLPEAVADYRQVLVEQPDNPLAYAGLGVALDLQGRHGEAQEVYRKGLAMHADSQALRIDLGLSLILGGNPREGANVLLDVTRIADAPPQGRQNLALAYGLLGNDDAAEKVLLTELPRASAQDDLHFYDA
ncbi:MAG: tetratricopeptide repeat protein, partial [Burkholderiales bacterium]